MTKEINKTGMSGTKWDLFLTAIDLFAEKCYNRVSIRDLAKRVGIKPASIYNHFESKDALLSAIFDFWEVNLKEYMPDIEEVCSYIGKIPPREVMLKAEFCFSEELQPIMENIIIIASSEMRNNDRAKRLIEDYMINNPKDYLREVLTRMIERDAIEPVNVEGFVNLYTNYCLGGAMRSNSCISFDRNEWISSIKIMLSIIKAKERVR